MNVTLSSLLISHIPLCYINCTHDGDEQEMAWRRQRCVPLEPKRRFGADRMSDSSHDAPIELRVGPDLAHVITPSASRRPSYASPTSFESLTLLIPGTILGLLARLGIQHLDSYPNAAIFSLAWVQGLGCLAMGAALGQKITLTKL